MPTPRGLLPSNGGLILFATDSERDRLIDETWVQAARFADTGKATFIDRQQLNGGPLEVLDAANRLLEHRGEARSYVLTVATPGGTRVRTSSGVEIGADPTAVAACAFHGLGQRLQPVERHHHAGKARAEHADAVKHDQRLALIVAWLCRPDDVWRVGQARRPGFAVCESLRPIASAAKPRHRRAAPRSNIRARSMRRRSSHWNEARASIAMPRRRAHAGPGPRM